MLNSEPNPLHTPLAVGSWTPAERARPNSLESPECPMLLTPFRTHSFRNLSAATGDLLLLQPHLSEATCASESVKLGPMVADLHRCQLLCKHRLSEAPARHDHRSVALGALFTTMKGRLSRGPSASAQLSAEFPNYHYCVPKCACTCIHLIVSPFMP